MQHCRDDLAANGMYQLVGFIRPEPLSNTVRLLAPMMASESSELRQWHTIYFSEEVSGLAADHPAMAKVHTVNHSLCADQLGASAITTLYHWAPFRAFLAASLDVPELHVMDDALASVNVLSYRPGEALNWHFDRSLYTITVVLQPPAEGGIFEYRSDLRTDNDPNHAGVGALLAGEDPSVATIDVEPGALNVFMGRNTAHRVTTVQGDVERMIAVLSYYDRPCVSFDDSERMRFYGRTGATETGTAER